MKIDLAYPYDGHQPDETIEVDDDVGRQMIRDGYARPADKPTAKTAATKKES